MAHSQQYHWNCHWFKQHKWFFSLEFWPDLLKQKKTLSQTREKEKKEISQTVGRNGRHSFIFVFLPFLVLLTSSVLFPHRMQIIENDLNRILWASCITFQSTYWSHNSANYTQYPHRMNKTKKRKKMGKQVEWKIHMENVSWLSLMIIKIGIEYISMGFEWSVRCWWLS